MKKRDKIKILKKPINTALLFPDDIVTIDEVGEKYFTGISVYVKKNLLFGDEFEVIT